MVNDWLCNFSEGKHTINVIAFSKSKDESRLIEDFLKYTESKYLKEII